jgi:hypothetical protein
MAERERGTLQSQFRAVPEARAHVCTRAHSFAGAAPSSRLAGSAPQKLSQARDRRGCTTYRKNRCGRGAARKFAVPLGNCARFLDFPNSLVRPGHELLPDTGEKSHPPSSRGQSVRVPQVGERGGARENVTLAFIQLALRRLARE